METSFFISDEAGALFRFFPIGVPQRNAMVGLVFVLTTAGQATVEIDNRSYTLSAGALLTLLPSRLLCSVMCTDDFHCLTFAFRFDSMTDFPYVLPTLISEKIEHTPFLLLTAIEQERLEKWHAAINTHYTFKTHPSYKEILRSLTFIFTAEVSAIYANHPIKTTATHREELTDGFFSLLHEHLPMHRETSFYADRLCITSKYLARVIQQVTGHTPSYWIADFTVREAKTLLKSTTLTVTQISERFNFPNSSFFARYFKRYAGMAPLEYRLSQS